MSFLKKIQKDKILASIPGISFVDSEDPPSDVEISMEHTPEWGMDDVDGGEDGEGGWYEDEYNYRLNRCSTILYAVKDKTVIAHLGLNAENEVECVYVDHDERNSGVATQLYFEAVKKYGDIFSDPTAQETGAKSIWKRLKQLEPERVQLNRNRFAFYEEDD